MYHNIVVPLDGSELAEGVLPHIAAVVHSPAARIYLLSIAPPPKGAVQTGGNVSPAALVMEEEACMERELRAYLQLIAERLAPLGAEVQVHVRFGKQAEEILAFAGDVGADLITMSTHGRSGIGRWVFGSVADRVLRHSTCPVLLVRAGQEQKLSVAYQRILVPLDGSELAEQILPHVKSLIRSEHTRVYLLSVLTTGLSDRTATLLTSYPPGLQLVTTALRQAEVQLQSYLRSVAAALRDRGAITQIAVRSGSPAEEILLYAAEAEVDLIAMTTHGFSGVSRWVYGNVANKVLQGSRCPVLLVRPKPGEGEREV